MAYAESNDRNTAALHFALNRLMAAQQAGIIHGAHPATGQALLNEYHQYSPQIAAGVHNGAVLSPGFSPQPMPAPPAPVPAPAAHAQPQPQAAPGGRQQASFSPAGGGQSPASQQVKVNITLPHHSPATQQLLHTLMGGGTRVDAARGAPDIAGMQQQITSGNAHPFYDPKRPYLY